METDLELLQRASRCYESLRPFRLERERCKRYTYGDQWCDMVEDNGVKMSESEYIMRQGNMPLKNNLIRRLVRNVLGLYRNRWEQPRCNLADSPEEEARINRMLEVNNDRNRLGELYARTMEEFLISGLAVHKKWYGKREGKSMCRTDNIPPSHFFFDTASRDFRGGDVSMVGEVHEISCEEVLATFARDPEEASFLLQLLGVSPDDCYDVTCTIYEVWERRRPMRLYCHDLRCGRFYRCEGEAEQVDEENARRKRHREPEIIKKWKVEEEWRYSFLTPTGHLLRRGVSPYSHRSHPYVFKPYPYIDGEIHSFVNDIIDQQKLTNRLISMYDWILRASAKGVLLFPEGSFPEGVDINDIADEWSRFNGIIVYRPRQGVPLPQQVSSKSTDIGITQLLEIQMKMMEDISGVNGALQGKLESSTMSGRLYDQQTRNSMTAIADLMRSFDDFVSQGTRKDISNLIQFCHCLRGNR